MVGSYIGKCITGDRSLIYTIDDHAIGSCAAAGGDGEGLVGATIDNDGARWANAAICACRCCDRVGDELVNSSDRAVASDITKRVCGDSSLVRSVDDHTVNLVTTIRCDRESLI